MTLLFHQPDKNVKGYILKEKADLTVSKSFAVS